MPAMNTPTQRYARLAGAMYLLTMATAMFSEGYVRMTLLVADSAAQTAQNLIQSNQLYRLALVSDLLTFAGVVVLVWALYQLLRPVDARLAVLALGFRLVEGGAHFAAVAFGVTAMSLLAAGEYVRGFEPAQLHGLVGFALRAQGAGLNLGFIPLGLGSAVFAWLLWRSRYVPRWLSGWGIFASLLLASYALGVVAHPNVRDYFYIGMVPMFVYEVGLGLWLLFKGVRLEPDR
jgi:hypothetical protein